MLKPDQIAKIVATTESLIKSGQLKTDIQARYGYHQIKEAIQFYLKNQTAGKIILKPSLTKASEPIAKL